MSDKTASYDHLTKEQLINLLTINQEELENLEKQLDAAEEKLEILSDTSDLLYLAKQIVSFAKWHNAGYASDAKIADAKYQFVHIVEVSNEVCRRFNCVQSQNSFVVPERNLFS